ncbi:MAG: 4Fe-4S binding protein [Dehalococcoidia bacterium]|nr:4Fe-4S binding protein [Dehalococcoidia bacterium]
MCEFCIKHGEGQKWYLSMRNYSRELLEQKGSEQYMEHFMVRFEEDFGRGLASLDSAGRLPIAGRFIRRMASRRQKAIHWGQVVPVEDVEQILDLQSSIVRMPCVCRSLTAGREARFCLGVGVDITGMLGKYPDYSESFEVLEKDEAKSLARSFDQQGLVHSVWTFKTPYIGGICNCDQDCLAYRTQVKTQTMPVMFRAEYVALVDLDLCNGCKKCMLHCQFGAIRYSAALKRATIETGLCYGCGVCRALCGQGAIKLKPRSEFASLPW